MIYTKIYQDLVNSGNMVYMMSCRIDIVNSISNVPQNDIMVILQAYVLQSISLLPTLAASIVSIPQAEGVRIIYIHIYIYIYRYMYRERERERAL